MRFRGGGIGHAAMRSDIEALGIGVDDIEPDDDVRVEADDHEKGSDSDEESSSESESESESEKEMADRLKSDDSDGNIGAEDGEETWEDEFDGLGFGEW